jgi:hypothetical protein
MLFKRREPGFDLMDSAEKSCASGFNFILFLNECVDFAGGGGGSGDENKEQ